MKHIRLQQMALSFSVSTLCGFTLACGGGAAPLPTTMRAVVTTTQNPLVAQVSIISPCEGTASVEFGPDLSYGRNTSSYPVQRSIEGTNILVAGMRPSTTYHMLPTVQCASGTLTGQDMIFQTGSLPSIAGSLPQMTVTRPNPSAGSPENPGIELVHAFTPHVNKIQAYFTDRDANPIWYYDVGSASGNYPFAVKLLPNGHVILSIDNSPVGNISSGDSTLREIDLAGNTIREMDIAALVQKTQAAGYDFTPTFYHHDVLPLDNGHVIVLVNTLKNFTDLVGYPGTTQVLGDALIDLDADWNPVWSWNGFDHQDMLSVDRHLFGLPDWTHGNGIAYSASDGNLLLSLRNQSWVLKIDYNNGNGTGNILWRLGYHGDFALTVRGVPSTDPSEWFAAQHFPSIVSQTGSQTTLVIWDNGDSRAIDTTGGECGPPPSPACYSRATVFQVDDSAMVADLPWDTLPGYFSIWGGSINQLENGNVEFDINAPQTPNTIASEVQEVTQTLTPQIVWQMDFADSNAYRAYRVPSLYPGVTWQY